MKSGRALEVLIFFSLFFSILHGSYEIISENDTGISVRFKLPEYTISETGRLEFSENPEPDVEIQQMFGFYVHVPSGCDYKLTYSIAQKKQTANLSELKKSEAVFVSMDGYLRNRRVILVNINPLSNSNGTAYINLDIEINVSFTQSNNPDVLDPRYESTTFDEFVRSLVINRNSLNQSEYRRGSYLIIHPDEPALASAISNFVLTKRLKGLEVHTRSFGTNSLNTEIKQYIQNAYDTWDTPPEYVLLLGNAVNSYIVQTWFEDFDGNTVHGDHPYSLMEGNDVFPDLQIGRITYASIGEMQAILTKIINYEYYPARGGTDWYERVLLVGDHIDSGSSTVLTMEYVNDMMDEYPVDYSYSLVYNQPYVNGIQNALNDGVGVYFYRGFGTFSHWTETNTANLQNYNQTPLISAITCFTGNFDQFYPSDVEEFLHLGTPSSPRGAVAAYGSTSATHTCFNNIITSGAASCFYQDGNFNISAGLNKGKLELYRNYPWNPNNYSDWYTLGKEHFGDPELTLRNRAPGTIINDHLDYFSFNSNFYSGYLRDESGTGISGANVTLYDSFIDTCYSAVSDINGYYQIPLQLSLMTELQLFAFHPQMIPVLDTVFAGNGSYDLDLRCELNSDIAAGVETVVPFKLLNNSDADFQNVAVRVYCDTSNVSIIDTLINIPSVSSQSYSTYDITVNPGYSIENEGSMILRTELSYSTQVLTFMHSLDVQNAVVELEGVNLLSIPAPQMDVSFTLHISNDTDLALDSLSLELSTDDRRISITDSVCYVDHLDSNSSLITGVPFVFNYADIFNTESFQFFIDITNDRGFCQRIEFSVDNTEPQLNHPTGPDPYGYIAVHNSDDALYQPVQYNWIEIDPNSGGWGTLIDMLDYDYEGSGDMVTIPLPFSFRFYGDLYHNISISSNGFVMPGIHYNYDWMNRSLPSEAGPRPMIAPFWDDLLIGENSSVSYMNNVSNHTFIIQWNNLLNRYDNSLEKFQLIIYDNEFHSLPGRENSFAFQYNVINNVDQGNYEGFYLDHGEYASVGITDKTGQKGLEYTFSQRYPVTAQIITSGDAVLFRHCFDSPEEAFIILDDFSITDSNNDGDVNNGEQVNLDIDIRNIGLSNCDSVRVSFRSGSQYLSISSDAVSINNIPSENAVSVNSDVSFSISSTCPNKEKVNLFIIIEHDGRYAEYECSWKVVSPELKFQKFEYADGENNQIENLETGDFSIVFEKRGTINIQNPQFSISSNVPGITLGTPLFLETGEFFKVTMPMITDNTLAQGLKIEFTGNISYNNGYNSDFTFYDVCGAFETVFSDDFTNNWQEWWMRNGTIVGTSNAGGTPPEVRMSTNPDYESILANYSFTGDIYRKLRVTFKNQLVNSPLKRTVKIVDMSPLRRNYFFISETMPTNGSVEEVHSVIPAVRFYDFANLYFTAGVEQTPTANWYIDDVLLEGVRISRYRLHGKVNLAGNGSDYENVKLWLDDNVFSPYSDGGFEIYANDDHVILDVRTKGYINRSINYFIYSNSDGSDELNYHDVDLMKLPAPQNLTYTINGNQLDLDWDFNNNSVITFSNFKIVRETGGHTFIDSSSVTNFSLDLQNDRNHKVYVYADYADDMESHNTDTLDIRFVDTEDVDKPEFITKLCNNFPNPFNPSTIIRFSIARDNTFAELSVYNIKGQKVRTLVSEELTSGIHEILWYGDNSINKKVASGVYFVKLKTKDVSQLRKVLLLK